jgi:hypothetical protein
MGGKHREAVAKGIGMQGLSLPFALLAGFMGFLVCWEIRSERLQGVLHWVTLARYPRGFPIIVASQAMLFLCLVVLATVFALSSS